MRSHSMQGPESRTHFPPHFAKLLAPSKHLQGHAGCVNRLAWNENGTMLASGSDDRKVMLWSYPDTDRAPTCIDTRHELNIFGVEFLPCTGSSMVISAAYDRMVQLHRLDTTSVPTAGPYRPPNRGSAPIATQSVQCHTQVFTNHSESVKDVAVEKGNPNCFWSASVDGRVHQFDLRASNLTEPDAPNMLIQAPQFGGNGGYRLEFNSLDINNVRPWLMATACSDHLVRVYDRRKLSLRDPAASAASVSLLDLCPLHLHLPGQHADRVYTTCARFSHRGDRLVTTYHSEHAYTFDVQGSSRPPEMSFCATRPNSSALEAAARNNDAGGMTGPPGAPNATPLDDRASNMRSEANQAVMQDRWDEALKLYNQLILRVPWLAHSWAARAIVLLHRGWKGDYVWALRDADTCVALNPRWHKAYETRVRCLKVLGQIRTAMTELNLLLEEFPDEAGSRTIQALREQLEKELAAQEAKRLQKHSNPAGVAPNGHPSDPRMKTAAEASPGAQSFVCPSHAPCRSFRAYLKSLQPDSEPADMPNDAAEPSRAPLDHGVSHKQHEAGCSHEHEPFYPQRNGHASASTSTYEPGHSTAAAVAAEAAVYGEVGNSAEVEEAAAAHAPQAPGPYGMVWNDGVSSLTALHAEQLGYEPHPPPADDGASEGPSGTVRWVRNAIQRSWGAWLAGESAPGAWQMCREQATTPADAVFLDALRGHKSLGENGVHVPPGGGADAHMADASAILSVAGSSGEDLGAAPLGVLSAGGLHSGARAAMESRNSSRFHMASHEWSSADHIGEPGTRTGTLNGSREAAAAAEAACSPSGNGPHVTSQNCLDCPSDIDSPAHARGRGNATADEDPEGSASLAGEADNTLRRLGAVVDDDDHGGGVDDDDADGGGEGSDPYEHDVESDDDSFNTEMYDWVRGIRNAGSHRRPPQQPAGPELMSYIYGHRSWSVPSHERFQPPAGCGHIDSISSLEAAAAYSMRTLQRFVGQCNVVTHIKEAAFVGPDDHIVACGSDRGNVFLFDSITGELLRVLAADEEVANCVQCHPTLPVLATSGLEYVVKLWEVQEADEATAVGSAEASMDQLVRENQQRLNSVQVHVSSDAELESIVQNSEILGLTRVRFGDGRQMTCRQS